MAEKGILFSLIKKPRYDFNVKCDGSDGPEMNFSKKDQYIMVANTHVGSHNKQVSYASRLKQISHFEVGFKEAKSQFKDIIGNDELFNEMEEVFLGDFNTDRNEWMGKDIIQDAIIGKGMVASDNRFAIQVQDEQKKTF
jgi:hypothetical protein